MLEATMHHRKWIVNVNAVNTGIPTTRDVSAMQWHIRLGHLSNERLNRVLKSLDLPKLTEVEDQQLRSCEACGLAKATRVPHKHYSEHLSKVPGERIHFDSVGPMREVPVEHKYAIFAVDDCSRYVRACPMQNKTE